MKLIFAFLVLVPCGMAQFSWVSSFYQPAYDNLESRRFGIFSKLYDSNLRRKFGSIYITEDALKKKVDTIYERIDSVEKALKEKDSINTLAIENLKTSNKEQDTKIEDAAAEVERNAAAGKKLQVIFILFC